jgi:hypothetical protein
VVSPHLGRPRRSFLLLAVITACSGRDRKEKRLSPLCTCWDFSANGSVKFPWGKYLLFTATVDGFFPCTVLTLCMEILIGRACLPYQISPAVLQRHQLSVRKEREAWVDQKAAAAPVRDSTGDAHIRTTTTIGTPRVACLLATVYTRTYASSSLTTLFLLYSTALLNFAS